MITYCEAQAGHRNNQLVRFCCTGDLWESILSLWSVWLGGDYWGGPSRSVWDYRPHSLTQGGCEAGIHHSQVEWVSETRIHYCWSQGRWTLDIRAYGEWEEVRVGVKRGWKRIVKSTLVPLAVRGKWTGQWLPGLLPLILLQHSFHTQLSWVLAK